MALHGRREADANEGGAVAQGRAWSSHVRGPRTSWKGSSQELPHSRTDRSVLLIVNSVRPGWTLPPEATHQPEARHLPETPRTMGTNWFKSMEKASDWP